MGNANGSQRSPRPLAALSARLPSARSALAQELRRGRDIANVSLSALAKATFSSKASISRWLSGTTLPSRDQAKRWAEHCGTDSAEMLRLWDVAAAVDTTSTSAVSVVGDGGSTADAGTPTVVDDSAAKPQSRRRRWITLGAVMVLTLAGVVVTTLLSAAESACTAAFPLELEMPGTTGATFGVTIKADCDGALERSYYLVEELPDVDPRNPHPAFFLKGEFGALTAGSSTSMQLLIREPVDTQAMFFVISVDSAGKRALGQNHVEDDGLLELPVGHRQESAMVWHRKGWE
ncbi:helix-turn-helix domain-containing protein [Amycolatopsis sp. cmx-8-4]|uniref:helix-turn-helix domain-containing protein n=1 Tax=Amycolatopsis sp. cmx-8-4 TaxID=2790947 RepID=UPI00397926A0